MNPGDEVVTLEVDGRKIDHWIQYAINSHFLIPADGFSFVLGGDSITPDLIKLLRPGKSVRIAVEGLTQCSGYIDRIRPHTSRSGGTTITVEGRDRFGLLLDSQIDPRKKWPDVTLDRFIADTLGPFGFSTFFVDNEKNTNVQAGKAVKRRRTPKKLKEYKPTYAKPQDNESMFSFVSRITQHLGLWIWPTVDGEGVVVGTPDFDQPARYNIVNRLHGGAKNTILEGGVERDASGMPSYIVGRGRVPGKTTERVKTTVVLGNPVPALVGTAPVGEQSTGETFGEAGFSWSDTGRRVILEKETISLPSPTVEWGNEFASLMARPIYVTDDSSRTIEELKRFVQREMSLRMRRAVVGSYTVAGHTQNGVPWTIDSVCDVVDELSDWQRPLWIMSRTFRRIRSSGTFTELEMVPLNSLSF